MACQHHERGSQESADTRRSLYQTTYGLAKETDYIRMLLDLDCIPWSHNFCAGFSNWILLAGYLVVPGTFTSLQKSQVIQDNIEESKAQHMVLSTIQNPPLLTIACFLFVAGASGLCWLGWTWRENYIWLINRLYLPGLLNSVAGSITTLVNVYTARGGDWSAMAIATVVITGVSTLVTGGLFLLYKFQKLAKVKEAHESEQKESSQRI